MISSLKSMASKAMITLWFGGAQPEPPRKALFGRMKQFGEGYY